MAISESSSEAIFFAALEKGSPEERVRYLAEACGADTELRSRIERMLDAHARVGVLDAPAITAEQDLPLDPPTLLTPPGTVIGRYKILEPIGEGGYGTVFMAEQTTPVHRKVAMKIIKAGMDTKQVIARFEAERQALALMDHPNIAKVFDAGVTEAGRPYFVMELVKGVPITKYCDDRHLTPRDRLELFVQVCHAVQHAHQKGIIHRDLKPTNVLVAMYDGKPVPKVIDFGVAKATGQQLTERTMFTGFGDVIGTPQYMSPEQAELNQLDIDTRSDIYSLGVLLYELLTGTTPLESKRIKEVALLEVLRVIREEEPPRPSTRLTTTAQLPSIAAQRGLEPKKLSGMVHGELDWIVMKALEKDRSRRYETANGFAMDVQRYLRDEAVQACPPSAPYRFRKFARRNKIALMTTAVVAAALVLGTAISTWQAVRASRAERAAAAQAQRANEQAQRANEQAQRANEQAQRAIEEAAKANASLALIQEMLSSANVHSGKGSEYTVRQLLDDFSARLAQRLKGQPELEAALRTTIGEAYHSLGMTAKSKAQLQATLELLRQSSGEQSEPTARILIKLAWLSDYEGDKERAIALAKDALQIYRSLQPVPPARLDALTSLQAFLAYNNPVESEQLGTEALAIARAAGESQRGTVPAIIQRLAVAKLTQGQVTEAEKLAREAIELHRQVNGADHPQTGWALYVLGEVLDKQGRSSEAQSCFQETLRIFRKNHLANPNAITLVLKRLKSPETAPSQEKQQSGR